MKRNITITTSILLAALLLLSACAAPVQAPEVPQHAETPAATEQPAAAPTEAPTAIPEIAAEINKNIDARRESILNSTADVAISGTCYYVSADGDDANDGLSPETPWQTIAKVNETEFAEGDGIRFRRGDVWRGEMIWHYYPGITYATYGEGAKPAFYGSPFNGAGAEKWTLQEGTDNFWIYHEPMPFCGSITMNGGEVVATQQYAYWNGSAYTKYGTDDVPLDLTQMKDMTFFVDVDLTEWQKDPELHGENGDPYVYDCMVPGTLILRCDAGNPGELYDDIEFCCGWGPRVGSGCMVDNLCVKYVGNCGVMSDPGGAEGITVQNCEIAFMGDLYIHFEASDFHGVGGGEGVNFNGYGSKCLNNYIHNGRDGGFTIELGWDGTVQDGQQKMGGMVCTGNLFEKNNGGIGFINFLEKDAPIEISDITIEDNIFSKIGYGNDLYDGVQPEVACIHVWFAGAWDELRDVTLRGNTFYLGYTKLINLLNIGEAQLDFEGNTYVQGMFQQVLTYAPTYDTQTEYFASDPAEFETAVTQILGDSTGRYYCYFEGLENREMERAYTLGIVPDTAPQDMTEQITSAQLTELLTKLVALIDADKLPAWTEVSAAAKASDAPILRADGFIALYEAALILGCADSNRENSAVAEEMGWDKLWEEIECMNGELYPNMYETGIRDDLPDFRLYHNSILYAFERYCDASSSWLFDYDAESCSMHGADPLTWEMAIKACVRLYDSLDYDTFVHYLVEE